MIPPNFRLATGVSKFTGESKPDKWLEDYRVAVQIGGGNDEVAMKHLPLISRRLGQSVAESVSTQQHLHLGGSLPSVCHHI